MSAKRDFSELLVLAPHMRGRMCYLMLLGLRDPDHCIRRKNLQVSAGRLLPKMVKLGLITKIEPGVWKINLEYFRKVAYVVSDDLFDKIADPEQMFEYKKSIGKYRKNISYEQQKAQWARRDRASKEVKKANRLKYEKEGNKDAEKLSEILFIDKEE